MLASSAFGDVPVRRRPDRVRHDHAVVAVDHRRKVHLSVAGLDLGDVRECISSNWCEQCRHLFWTLSAFMLDGMGGWLVSLVVVYFMSEWVFR